MLNKKEKSVFLSSKIMVYVVVILILIILAGLIYIYFFQGSEYIDFLPTQYKKTWTQENLGNLEINGGTVGYVMEKFGASELNKIPLTSNTPKIMVVVDGQVYFVEVIDGSIVSMLGKREDVDMIISMDGEDIIEILNESNDAVSEIRKSVNEGTTKFETVVGKSELLAKGYYKLYRKFTGEEPTI